MKHSVAVLFGGTSSEHEISLLSAANVLTHLDAARYQVFPIGIQRDGTWHLFHGSPQAVSNGSWQHGRTTPVAFCPGSGKRGLIAFEADGIREIPIDVVFPVLHGKHGEDGTVQGLLELADIAYVGCGVLGSAVCMDKVTANLIMDAAGIARCAWTWLEQHELSQFDEIEARAAAKLGYPMFVKPSAAGSSVGISKAHNKAQLRAAVELALHHDSRVVLERFVRGQEIECAVRGNESLLVTPPGEILATDEFYTYDDKYVCGTSQTIIPARLSPSVAQQTMHIAAKAYRTLSCRGLARIDFFIECDTGRILLNEINTMPGFTAISMYPKLMLHQGESYAALLDSFIHLALERKRLHHAKL